jgi:hypothetical protein
MSAFVNNDITVAGLLVLAKGQTGSQIKFTKIVIGEGYLPPTQNPRDLTQVVAPVVTLPIVKCKLNHDGSVLIGGILLNSMIDREFYYRELALYTEDPDLGEVLYCYGNAGDDAEKIIPSGGSVVLEKIIDLITIIGKATNVTAVIPSDIYVTRKELEDAVAEAITNTKAVYIGYDNSKSQLVANNIQDAIDELNDKITKEADVIGGEIGDHMKDTMPHRFTADGKVYRWGLAVIGGVVNMVYEEV